MKGMKGHETRVPRGWINYEIRERREAGVTALLRVFTTETTENTELGGINHERHEGI